MAGTLDPQRVEVFNLRDCSVEIWTEDNAGAQDTKLTDYLIYVHTAVLVDKIGLRKNYQCGAVGRRITTHSHDYTLSLSRFQAKDEADFGLAAVSADATYQIKLVFVNEDNPSLTETHTLNHCQIASRSIRMQELVNNVPTIWAVGQYVAP